MIGETRREQIRRLHRPDQHDRCAVVSEAYPCAAVLLLTELESVEAVARNMQQEVARLGAEVTALKSRMNAAVELLTTAGLS